MSTPYEPATRATARETIASYPRYPDAERAVDYLSDHDFPVRHTMIVGRGLDMVEQVTGRYTVGSAAGRGAAGGAVVGALLGALGHAATRGRRDFSSVPGFRAQSYDVLADTEVADRARELLRAEDGPGLGQADETR